VRRCTNEQRQHKGKHAHRRTDPDGRFIHAMLCEPYAEKGANGRRNCNAKREIPNALTLAFERNNRRDDRGSRRRGKPVGKPVNHTNCLKLEH